MNKLAVTMGDPRGVGPEIVAKLASRFPRDRAALTLFGDPVILDAAARLQNLPPVAQWGCEVVAVTADPQWRNWSEAQCGEFSRQYVARAVEFCLSEGAALVTAPINKHRWQLTKEEGRGTRDDSASPSSGHTEYLAYLTRSQTVGMMMAGPRLRTVPVTIHEPLARVATQLTVEKIILKSVLTYEFLQKRFKIKTPRLAVTGLNPHAGEQGDLGREELSIIGPAIRQLRDRGWDITGPLPADGLFARIASLPSPLFDAVICMYHDQALIPAKMLDYQSTVNITMGLPFVRTSPDHGTAEDIAWKNQADAQHLHAAVEMAITLAGGVITYGQN